MAIPKEAKIVGKSVTKEVESAAAWNGSRQRLSNLSMRYEKAKVDAQSKAIQPNR